MMTTNTKPVDIVIPIYKASFDTEEKFAIDQSFSVLAAYPIVFVAPHGLDVSFYTAAYPNATFIYFEERYFKSVNDYSRLLVSDEFYEAFESEFLLIVQPDVYLFHDDLPYWVSSPFDYVGAPWPNGLSLNIKFGKFDLGGAGTPITVYVGNGGLSLRRRKKCMALIAEHREIADWFIRSGSNEDLFFAFMGALSADFVIPNQVTASLFALEVSPERFFTINGEKLPMGVHRYRDYSSDFWKPRIPSPGFLQQA